MRLIDTEPDVVVYPADDDTAARAAVVWCDSDGLELVAWVHRGLDNLLEVYGFEVSSNGSVPPSVRRLPSDVQVLHAMRSTGPHGRTAMAFLLDDPDAQESALSAYLDQERDPATPLPDSAVEGALAEYTQDIIRRPRKRAREQAAAVAEQIQNGDQTKDIVRDLVASGLSRRTAFRRIETARAMLRPKHDFPSDVKQDPTDSETNHER